MLDSVREAAEATSDTLLVYFADHGLLDGRGELFFTLPRSVQALACLLHPADLLLWSCDCSPYGR